MNSPKEPIPGLKLEGGVGEAQMSRIEVRGQGLGKVQNGAAVPPAVRLISIPISIHSVFWRPTQVYVGLESILLWTPVPLPISPSQASSNPSPPKFMEPRTPVLSMCYHSQSPVTLR